MPAPKASAPTPDKPEALPDHPQPSAPQPSDTEAGQTEAEVTEAEVTEAESDEAVQVQEDQVPAEGGARWRQVVTLLVAAAVLAGFAVWAAVHASDLRASRADSNLALSDKTLTRQVTSQVSGAVDTIFSYSYANPAATRRAAQRVLTGSAISQYNKLFTLVEQKAPAEKLVLHTKVTDIGVELLTNDRARLLVFVNQQDQAGSGQAVYSGAMFAVTAVRHGSHWLISNINTFTSSG